MGIGWIGEGREKQARKMPKAMKNSRLFQPIVQRARFHPASASRRQPPFAGVLAQKQLKQRRQDVFDAGRHLLTGVDLVPLTDAINTTSAQGRMGGKNPLRRRNAVRGTGKPHTLARRTVFPTILE